MLGAKTISTRSDRKNRCHGAFDALFRISRLEGRFRFLRNPGPWFWIALTLGVCLRVYLVVFTEGTYDVSTWEEHAQGVLEHGLIEQYRSSEGLNHPPLACWVARSMVVVCQWTGAPFRMVLRAPVALVDVGTALLLGWLLRRTRYRWLAIAGYAVHPLAVILSAYHGNTDSLIGFLVVLAIVLASEDRPGLAGAAIGVSLWIKLPGLLVVPVWGVQNFLGLLAYLPASRQPAATSAVFWLFDHNRETILVPLVGYAWMRRGERSPTGLGMTLAGSFAMVYAFTNNWSFQYLAWSVPVWFLAGPMFLAGATLLAGGYIVALYAYECGNPFLLGTWDFMGHPEWPHYLLFLRDASVVFFFSAAMIVLARGLRGEWRRIRS